MIGNQNLFVLGILFGGLTLQTSVCCCSRFICSWGDLGLGLGYCYHFRCADTSSTIRTTCCANNSVAIVHSAHMLVFMVVGNIFPIIFRHCHICYTIQKALLLSCLLPPVQILLLASLATRERTTLHPGQF